MEPSRREIIGSLSSLSLAGLAGCGILGGDDQQTTEQNPDEDTGNEPEETTPAPENTTATAESVEFQELAAATGQVLSEIEWFGTSYVSSIAQYKGHTKRLYDTTEYLRRRPELSESNLNRLESNAGELTTLLEGTLAPHFENSDDYTATADIVSTIDTRVSTIRRFSERGDTNRVESELTSLRIYIDNIRRPESINERFSMLPIHRPLLDYLTSSNYNPSNTFTFIIAHPETDYATSVRSRERKDATMGHLPPETKLERRKYISDLKNIFGGVSVERGRNGRGFVAAHPRKENQPTRLMDIQRFESPALAAEAERTLLDGPVTSEGPAELGTYEWQKIRYYQLLEVLDPNSGYIVFREGDGMVFNQDGDVIRQDSGDLGDPLEDYSRDLIGDIVYAYMKRAGPYLLTIAPSMTAWEERDNNDVKPLEPLKKTWPW